MDNLDAALTELKRLHERYKTDRFSKLGISIALGVNRRTVRRWFQGKYPPTKEHSRMIARLVKDLTKSISSQDSP